MVALGSVISTKASSSGDLLVPVPAARSSAWSSFLASSPSVGLGRFLAEVAALGDFVAAAAEAPFAAAEAEAAAAPVKDGVMMAGNSGGVDVLLVLVPVVGSVRCLLLADAAAAMADASAAMDAAVSVDRGGAGASSSELSSITMIADDIVAGRYERK